MSIKDHIIEIEEYLVFERKKILHSKIVPYSYIYYVPPYINDGVGDIVKSIFEFIDSDKAKSYLNTKFDAETNEVKYYETSHKRRYNEITQDGIDFLYGNLCKNDEPELFKAIREENIPCVLNNILLSNTGEVESLSLIIRSDDLLMFKEYINYDKLEDLLEIIKEREVLEKRCIIKFDLKTKNIWVGYIDGVSPKMFLSEIFENRDWQKSKEEVCSMLVEKGIISNEDKEFMISKTSGRQSMTVKFLLKDNQVKEIHYNNMVVFDFEEITD